MMRDALKAASVREAPESGEEENCETDALHWAPKISAFVWKAGNLWIQNASEAVAGSRSNRQSRTHLQPAHKIQEVCCECEKLPK